MIKDQMEKIYTTIPLDQIPWNELSPPAILREIVESGKIRPCAVIEFGCGAGNYLIYLAGRAFAATGVDISETAIGMARKRAVEKGVRCTFVAADVLGGIPAVQGPFAFGYDWQLLHHIFPPDREKYMDNVQRLLNPGAYYLSLCFSEQSPQFGGTGKYRKTPLDTVLYFSSEKEIEDLLKPHFKIEELKTIEIQGKFAPHKAVYAFSRRK